MFRAANNPFDDAVVKATDENLTSENWALILDVCDRVTTSPSGPSSVTASLIKRLAHRNANVQLYTLELANALSQNCGPPLHRELASRSFTDALLRLANDRNTHQAVKTKVMERMGEWVEMFGKDPDFGIMDQAYQKLRAGHPALAPPSKPVKKGMSDEDRRKEEEELQMALALSLKDKAEDVGANVSTSGAAADAVAAGSSSSATQGGPSGQLQPGTTAATVSRVKALYDFTPSEAGELAFRTGDIIAVLESVYKDWWKGSLRGQTGIFPLNYVEKLQDPTVEELERDANMEGEVFSQIRNVEKLLSLLSVRQDGMGGGSRDQGTEEEITELYNQTLAIRPKLIELIGKYSQKKDDFTQLNEKFIKARRDYEALLESSMSAPQYPMHSGQRQSSQPYYANAYGPPQPQAYAPPPSQQQQQQQQSYPPQSYAPPQRQSSYPSQPEQPPPQQQQQQQQQQPPRTATYAYNPTNSPPAPFHFLPNGVTAPPHPQQSQPPHPQDPSLDQPYPSPPLQQHHQFPPHHQSPVQTQHRPHSIQTLNSGHPQELASGGPHESPVETVAWQQEQARQRGEQQYAPQTQQLPIRTQQQPQGSESGTVYGSDGLSQAGGYAHATYGQASAPPPPPQQPGHAPPGVPGIGGGTGTGMSSAYPSLGGYQAYDPHSSSAAAAAAAAAAASSTAASVPGEDDASDFYR